MPKRRIQITELQKQEIEKNKRKRTINKISYFFTNSLNKSLNQMLEQKISPRKRWSWRTIRELLHEK